MRILGGLRRLLRNSDKVSVTIEAIVQGIDNQQKQLNELKGLLSEIVELQRRQADLQHHQVETQKAQLETQKVQLETQKVQLETQKAQLVMQRDHAEAIDALCASITVPTATKHHELEQ